MSKESVDFKLLVVDDERTFAETLGKALANIGFEVDVALDARAALERARGGTYDMILLDYRLPDDDGIRLIPILSSMQRDCIVIMMTAYESINNAVQAIRQGAYDYIVKSTTIVPIIERVKEAAKRKAVRKRSDSWRGHSSDGLLGVSKAINHVREQLGRVAASPETTVLITGESGVGKEVAAKLLHDTSRGRELPFITVDCMSIPEHLAESLLFGHEKGSFTGADISRKGNVADVGEGSLFLDEIGDLDIKLQGKLLRLLESRTYRRLGSNSESPFLGRIIAATNRNLQELVQRGEFRFDLLQRLSVFPIYIPPLRERREDIAVLAEHFQTFFFSRLGKKAEPLSKETLDALVSYDYSGNVRELKNIIERAVILAEGERIELCHLPQRLLHKELKSAPISQAGGSSFLNADFVPGVDTIDSFELKLIERALELSGGVKKEAAKMLGISRFQLLRKLEKYNKPK